MDESGSQALSVVVAAKPDLMRRSLEAFLRTISAVTVVILVDDADSVPGTIRQHHPRTIIVDANLSSETVPSLVERLRLEHPTLNCVVLADTIQQQKLFLAAGANSAPLKGFLDEQLTLAVLGMTDGNTAYSAIRP